MHQCLVFSKAVHAHEEAFNSEIRLTGFLQPRLVHLSTSRSNLCLHSRFRQIGSFPSEGGVKTQTISFFHLYLITLFIMSYSFQLYGAIVPQFVILFLFTFSFCCSKKWKKYIVMMQRVFYVQCSNSLPVLPTQQPEAGPGITLVVKYFRYLLSIQVC